MKKLYKFSWNCGRNGDVKGIFISTPEEIRANLGQRVYFGEILGKHSEVYGDLEEKDLTILSEDQEFISKFETTIGKSFGRNPLNYIGQE